MRDELAELKRKQGRKGGVIHHENHDWSWTGIKDEAKLDDGHITLKPAHENG